ncbi:IS4 family transposase [Methylomarinum sp. Ch1-1]|uniref:IS4 family transposase n=1 Tax=Methylomarinum roseum TaxID=3067653 RepID=A0AAU7NYC9_9GAMM|nr:IS4 family transposase [Methylomarinum sp. Ch1-1]MDP4521916.1 IS4 family transposase [Methylomarinum sp. Ch1-1]
MFYSTRKRLDQQIRHFKQTFIQRHDLPFDDLLKNQEITHFIEQSGFLRDRVFTPLVTLKAFISQVLSEDQSCKLTVSRLLTERLKRGLKPNTVNTGPYCKARRRLPLAPIIGMAKGIGKRLHQSSAHAWKWKGHNVMLADGTTVLMPDTVHNQNEFPQQRNQKPGLGFPIARIVGLISLGTGAMTDYALGPYQGKGTGETSLFSQLLDSLTGGDLLLADRYYATYAIVALMQYMSADVLFKNHANRHADFRLGKKLGAKDHLIKWKKPLRKPVWMSKEAYADLPEVLLIRELRVDGVVYMTSLTDARKYRKKEIAELYRKRWQIELDIRSIKTHMRMEMLRCKTPENVRKEIAVHFLAYNLIRAALARSAKLCGKVPRQLSFKTAVQLINSASLDFFCCSPKRRKEVSISLLKSMAETLVGRQKRENQPRAIKRRPKPYSLLMEPRTLACRRLNA